MGDPHPGKDEAVFPVAVSRLVKVHEIHIDLIVGKLFIGLGMQMQKGLSELLKALYPHLCRREGMHPGDDANAVIIVGCLSAVCDAGRRIHNRRQKLHRNDVFELLIKEIHHFLTIGQNLLKAFLSVKVLTSGNKIQFVHFFSPF